LNRLTRLRFFSAYDDQGEFENIGKATFRVKTNHC